MLIQLVPPQNIPEVIFEAPLTIRVFVRRTYPKRFCERRRQTHAESGIVRRSRVVSASQHRPQIRPPLPLVAARGIYADPPTRLIFRLYLDQSPSATSVGGGFATGPFHSPLAIATSSSSIVSSNSRVSISAMATFS